MDYFRPNIQSLVGYTPGEQPQHGKYIKLNTSENPYPSSDRVLQAIGAVTAERLALYPDPVSHAFRAAVSEILDVPEDWILCGNGSDELLNLLIRTSPSTEPAPVVSYQGSRCQSLLRSTLAEPPLGESPRGTRCWARRLLGITVGRRLKKARSWAPHDSRQ